MRARNLRRLISRVIKSNKKTLKIKDIAVGFIDREELGITTYNGNLDIRPAYQRNDVYTTAEKQAVIMTILRGLPISDITWYKRADGTYEILDGQQRTLAICQFMNGDFAIELGNDLYDFDRLMEAGLGEDILNYDIFIDICEGGTEHSLEKLEWFKTINIAGKKLTEQELRNALHVGKWLTDAKRAFSIDKSRLCKRAGKYISGGKKINRQEYLEIALNWISDGAIDTFMTKNYRKDNANDLKEYWNNVFDWVERIFPKYDSIMKGLPWGSYYNKYKNMNLDHAEVAKRISKLMGDEDIEHKRKIYKYIFTGNIQDLDVRTFNKDQKRTMYYQQNECCGDCGEPFPIEELQAHHITKWEDNGKTEISNGIMLHDKCHRNRH